MKTIFVSSTFRDMDLERDAIQEQVYPRINSRARQYGQSVSFCDLRWGIDTSQLESEAGSRKVLDVCLDEIDRCQPPMVVVLGYRYGWIPSPELVQSTADRYRMQLQDLEKSVTSLEIEYGALSNSTRLQNTLFYFREIEGELPAGYAPEDAPHAARLAALKDRIRTLTGGRVRSYTLRRGPQGMDGVEDFAQMLEQDLLALLEPQWQADQARSPLDKEFYIHRAYLQEKARAFRARQALADRVLADIADGQQLTVLKGPVGSGKSTLFSHIAVRLEQQGWQVLPLFSNLTGQTNTAMEVLQLFVRRLEQLLEQPPFDAAAGGTVQSTGDTAQLKNVMNMNTTAEAAAEDLWQQRLEELCSLAEQRQAKLVLMLDAVDQLFEDALREKLAFIPNSLGASVRFVLTALPEVGTGAAQITQIGPVDDGDKCMVIRGILDAHNRELSEDVVAAMLQSAAADNPLYLSFLVQRLLMMNKQDFDSIRTGGDGMAAIARQQLELLRRCPDTLQGMSSELMDTAADRVGGDMVRQVLRLLAQTPHGLRISDLEGLLKAGFNRLDFAHFISYMNDCFVIRNDGRYDFSHKSIRQGLLEREADASQLHRQLLAWFDTLPDDDEVRQQEICHHAIGADDKAYFVAYLMQQPSLRCQTMQYAAKNVQERCRQDEGSWLRELIGTGSNRQETERLLDFVVRPFADISDQLAGDIKILAGICIVAVNLVRKLHEEFNDADTMHLYLDCLGLNAYCFEHMDSSVTIELAVSLRLDQYKVLDAALEAEPDSPRLQKRYANTLRRLADCCEKYSRIEPDTINDFVVKAINTYRAYFDKNNTWSNGLKLAELYLWGAEKMYGWVGHDFDMAEKCIFIAETYCTQMLEKEEDEDMLRCLAQAYGHKGRMYDARGEKELTSDYQERELACYRKEVEILERLCQLSASIANRVLLANACQRLSGSLLLVVADLWSTEENDVARQKPEAQQLEKERLHYMDRCIALYEGIVRERGSISDLRGLADAYHYAIDYRAYMTKADNTQEKIRLCRQELALREKLYGVLHADKEKVELGWAYQFLAGALQEEDPQQARLYREKVDELDVRGEMCAYTEVLEILRHMEPKYVNMVPKKLILYLYDRADFEHEFRMTKPIKDEKFSQKALEVLALISNRYWSSLTKK